MPEQNISKYKEAQMKLEMKNKPRGEDLCEKLVEFKWIGLNAIFRDKKDFVLLKLLGLKFKSQS